MKKYLGIMVVLALVLGTCGCTSEEVQKRQENKKEIQAEAQEANAKMPSQVAAFTTIDLAGNEVTEEVFKNADMTVINFWGTFCPPCIDEMPELGEWAKELPDNVQLIGIVIDVSGKITPEMPLAKEIVEKTGADYLHLIAADQFDEIIDCLVGVPTTIFVDREGNLIGDPIVSRDMEGYKNRVEEFVNGQN